MTKQAKRMADTRPAGPSRVIRRAVAIIIALSALMLAVPAAPAGAQTEPGTAAIEVHVAECPAGYEGANHYADCHANGIVGAQVSISGPTSDSKATVAAGGPGAVRFAEIPAGTYSVSVGVADAGQAWETYCSVEGGGEAPLAPADSPSGSVTVGDQQVVICDFYVIPPGASTGDSPVDEEDPPAGPASIVVDPVVCPPGTDPDGGFDALAGACAAPVENVTFTLGSGGGTVATANTDDDPAGQVAFGDLAPGAYTLYSDVPLGYAAERLFCTADGGERFPQTFSENGVTTFELDGEEIACDWFIVPIDQRGEGTGGSLTVHLAACPQEYEGTSYDDDCHGNGIADQEFFLTGPGVETSAVTTVPQEPGPGIAEFTELPGGEYTLAGGPPGDFGTVRLFCSLQPGGDPVETQLDSTRATLAIGEGEDIVCDWFYIPDNAQGETPTPTPPPAERAEIVVTLLACDPGAALAGASYGDFAAACDTPKDGVTFSLGDPAAPPLSARTGASGPGAVRFHDLLPADYTLTPSLPSGLSSAAVFCQIDGGETYQKSLTNGATTFVNVDGESITCEWFATLPAPQPSGPSGSITVREFLCEEDASEIEDFERECVAGTSGATFTVASMDGAITLTSATNASGVAAFTELPDGFYSLDQNEGAWCKARAERVDSKSRVIVENGQNTDVFIYQCEQVTGLPSTGTGTGIQPMDGDPVWWRAASPVEVAGMGAGVASVVLLAGWAVARRRVA